MQYTISATIIIKKIIPPAEMPNISKIVNFASLPLWPGLSGSGSGSGPGCGPGVGDGVGIIEDPSAEVTLGASKIFLSSKAK